jgi:hypothetical protein
MAHQFDTGLARAQRTLVRDGVVAVLSGLLRVNGGYLQAVVPWGGIVRGYTDEVGIDMLHRALNGRAPAIAVALGDRIAAPAGIGGFNFKADIELVLYHYSNHPRSMTSGRTTIDAAALASDVLDPGLDVQLEHAEDLLIGQRLGGPETTNEVNEKKRSTPTIKRIVPTREEELATEAGWTLWAQRYAVQVERTINPHRGVTQMLEEIRTLVRTTDPLQEPPADPVVELQNLTT